MILCLQKKMINDLERDDDLYSQKLINIKQQADQLLAYIKEQRKMYENEYGSCKATKKLKKIEKWIAEQIKLTNEKDGSTYGGPIHRLYKYMQSRYNNNGIKIEKTELN